MNTDIIKFLTGESDFCGLWFGDKHPTEPGAFWWRKHLSKYIDKIKSEKSYYQCCPKCQGEGFVSAVGTTTSPYRICPVCDGLKTLLVKTS